MNITGFDHVVLCVKDVAVTCDFYRDILGLEVREEREGKYSLHFGPNKISLQDAESIPDFARRTTPGSGNFCLLTETPIAVIVLILQEHDIEVIEGPARKVGARGDIMSVYFYDPDGNLVEVSNHV